MILQKQGLTSWSALVFLNGELYYQVQHLKKGRSSYRSLVE